MSLAERRWLRLGTLCALYFAQGLPWGFMVVTLPAHLAGGGLDAEAIGAITAMATLPFAFKWVWGPIIDAVTLRRFGRRRPWIVFAQGMMALTVGALIAIPDLTRDPELLMWMVLIHTVFNALQDVAVDALAVDVLPEAERGRANGLMYASKYAGGLVGGAGMATVVAAAGLRAALLVQVAVLVVIMLVPLCVRERDGAAPPDAPLGQAVRALGRAFTLRSTIALAAVMLGATLGSGGLAVAASVLFTRHLGWSDTAYAQLTGGPVLLVGLAGSVIGGFVADRIGHRRLAAIASIGLALSWAVFALAQPWWTSRAFIYAVVWIAPLCVALMNMALYALCMDVSWPRIAGTQFAAFMALANLSTTLGHKYAGDALAAWGFQGAYLAAAIVQVVVVAPLLLVDPHQTRRVLGDA